MATAADVPGVYDVVINGTGFILANSIQPNLPFRTQRATYGYSPTFLERTNVSGDYGDNQQSFWLTVTQKDWSLGEDQKFFRSQDADKSRQYWLGSNVNVSIPGQVSLNRDGPNLTLPATSSGAAAYPAGSVAFTVTSTNLVEVSSGGTVTDRGAHGAGGQVTGFACDGTFLYLSGVAATKVRKYDLGAHTFADFSAQNADSLVFLNNTLYGTLNNVLYTYDTAGTATASFTYKTATGAALPGTMKLCAFGGKVMILRTSGSTNGAELWEYDGTGVAKLAEYPGNFAAKDFCVQSGILFIIGQEARGGDGYRAAIWYYANGTIGRAWAHPVFSTTVGIGYAITPFGNGLLFTEPKDHLVRYYDLQTGGTSTVATLNSLGTPSALATADTFAILTNNSGLGFLLFDPTAVASTGWLETSVFDFESSLTKLFRGVIVDFVAGSDGDGGSVDIQYQINDVGGPYTLLQTGAATGTEYTFSSNTTGRGVSFKLILNKGTSTLGPTIKRVYVRAAPIQQQYRTAEYILDATGRNGKTPVMLRNGAPESRSGEALVAAFKTAALSSTPVSITDRLGTYTGIIEFDKSEIIEWRPQEYLIRCHTRGV